MKDEDLKNMLELHHKWLACEADGVRANLRSADLRSANLRYANLSYADLSYANLSYANLSYANLRYANLSYADLRYANLSYANLSYANLSSAKGVVEMQTTPEGRLILARMRITPVGTFTAFKKVYAESKPFLLTLLIEDSALRVNAPGSRKCRCSRAKVSLAESLDGAPVEHKEFYSGYDNTFMYRVGEYVEVLDYDDSLTDECSRGIHFFLTKEEAVDF